MPDLVDALEADGLLLHCCYRQPFGKALDEATVWGDFFFLDALLHAVEPGLRLDPLAPFTRPRAPV